MNEATHLRTFDLPNWRTPPRARDIATTPDTWGWVYLGGNGVVQDDLGQLWADGDGQPVVMVLSASSPAAFLAWTPKGLGLFIPPIFYGNLRSVSLLDMREQPDRWIQVSVALVSPSTPCAAATEVAADGTQ